MTHQDETTRVVPTSYAHAVANDIVLRKTNTTRLVFRPEIVKNPTDASSSVRGTFIFQKKENGVSWDDHESMSFSKFKGGDWYKLELKSGEISTLIAEINKNKAIFEQHGIPSGSTEYTILKDNAGALAGALADALTNEHIDVPDDFFEKSGAKTLAKLLEFVSSSTNSDELVKNLQEISTDAVSNIQNALAISQLKQALQIWEENKENSDEDFWQDYFAKNSWILSQVFSYPVVLLGEKMYVGGKKITNQRGQIVDYLYRNQLNGNVALVEIKTPTCGIVGSQYRKENAYSPSKDIAGGVTQVLSQKQTLLEEYRVLFSEENKETFGFSPKALLICGSYDYPETTKDEKRSFNLYRENSRGVEIITFDELFEKVKMMIALLDGDVQPPFENNSTEYVAVAAVTVDDVPF